MLLRLQGQSRFLDNLAKENLSSTGGMDMTGSMNDKKLDQGQAARVPENAKIVSIEPFYSG